MHYRATRKLGLLYGDVKELVRYRYYQTRDTLVKYRVCVCLSHDVMIYRGSIAFCDSVYLTRNSLIENQYWHKSKDRYLASRAKPPNTEPKGSV